MRRAVGVLLGLLFLAAGGLKAIDVPGFAALLVHNPLVPLALVNAVAMALPWIEIAAGAALVTGVLAEGGALVALILGVVFTFVNAYALARGLDLECGCFSPSSGTRLDGAHLLLDLAMLAAAGWLQRAL